MQRVSEIEKVSALREREIERSKKEYHIESEEIYQIVRVDTFL